MLLRSVQDAVVVSHVVVVSNRVSRLTKSIDELAATCRCRWLMVSLGLEALVLRFPWLCYSKFSIPGGVSKDAYASYQALILD